MYVFTDTIPPIRQRGSSEKHPTLDTEMIITEVDKNLTPVFGQAQYKWRG